MKKVAIIIPAYNEEKRIGESLKERSAFFENLFRKKMIDYEILVVINNTTDKTEEIVKSFQKDNKRINYINLKPGGKGFAIIQGFRWAIEKKFDLIGFVDSDLATSSEEYWKLIQNIDLNDGIIADRYIKGSQVFPSTTFRRLIVSRIFNSLTRSILFLTYKDTQCGAKLFTSQALEKIMPLLSMSQWAFDVDLLFNLKRGGYKIKSFPTLWMDKKYATINFWSAGPWMAIAIIRLRIINSPLKRFVRIYDNLIGVIPK